MSTETRGNAYVLEVMKREFRNLGYVGGLLQENYEFVDILASEHTIGAIPLATFSQEPTSYRNASFGVALANGKSGRALVESYRSLGAPQIFEIAKDRIVRWKVAVDGRHVPLGEVTPELLPNLFSHYRSDWTPDEVLRTRLAAPRPTQLSFMDLGLLPLIESEVRTKLDQLLQDAMSAGISAYNIRQKLQTKDYPLLLGLIFRLVSSKVLMDRRHPAVGVGNDPKSLLAAIEAFYFGGETPEPVLDDPETQSAVWDIIRHRFHFQNLSVDALAYAYENTLVEPEARKALGIHSTPAAVAEYIVKQLPFEVIDQDERKVFEPFSGHSVFLMTAMQRLRELLPSSMNPDERHKYFVRMLSGIERDGFAREVARLSLMLADYPNSDGWNLVASDALHPEPFSTQLRSANIVLCNPPFEAFSTHERLIYNERSYKRKPAEVLHRVLQDAPQLLGFVLPRSFLSGREYRRLRSQLARTYGSLEFLSLPDNVFQRSEAESVVVVASNKNQDALRVKKGELYAWDDSSLFSLTPSYEYEESNPNVETEFANRISISELKDVWNATSTLRRLGDTSLIRRGIQYGIPFRENKDRLVSSEAFPGSVSGLHTVKGYVEPFLVLNTVHLNPSPDVALVPGRQDPWDQPKVIVNASRQSRGPWCITASHDRDGLMLYRNFHGIWPGEQLPVEVLAAVLNGPIANAFVSARGDKRYIRAASLQDVPIPDFGQAQLDSIVDLVQTYCLTRLSWLDGSVPGETAHAECSELLETLDAEVLKAYGLEPDLEQRLSDYFNAARFSEYKRLGPIHTVTIGRSPIQNPPDESSLDPVLRETLTSHLEAALEELSNIREHAEEEGSEEPTQQAIDNAGVILRSMYGISPRRYDIYPMGQGEVVIDGGGPTGRCVVFCYPDGRILYIGRIGNDGISERRPDAKDIPVRFLEQSLQQLDNGPA